MKTLRPIAFVLATLLLSALGTVSTWAQDDPYLEPGAGGQISGNLPDSRAGIITLEGLSGNQGLAPGAVTNAGFSYVHDSHYWDRNFYRVDAFLPYNLTPGTDYFYSILAGGVTQGGDGLVNLGLGYGYYAESWERLFRTTAWLDIDGEPNRTHVAIGAQTESLGRFIDTRGSIQLVTTDTTDTVFSGLTGTSQFIGNHYFFDGVRVTETAFHHADFEVGGPVAWLGDYGINMYGRGYYLKNTVRERDAIGVGIRGEWTMTEDITFNANYTHDDIFGSNTYLSIAVTTPDGAPQHVARPIPVNERFSKRPVRTGRIASIRERESTTTAAINPKTGQPYEFAHVNPNRVDGAGNGTFENAYGSIDTLINAGLAPFDIIYVRPRADGTSENLTVMDPTGVAPAATPLMLLDNQMLLSSTINQQIDILPTPAFGGNSIVIAALDPGFANPVLMNGSGVPNGIVYASNGNLISGFTFDGGGVHDGIRLDGSSIIGDGINEGIGTDLHVRNNTFQNSVFGIRANDLSDGMPMAGCTLLGHSTIWNNTFIDNTTGFDVRINTTNNASPGDTINGTNLTLSILGNNIGTAAGGNTTGGIVVANGAGATLDLANLAGADLNGNGQPDLAFAGNVVQNNGTGMIVRANAGGLVDVNVGALPGFQQVNPMNPVFFNQFTNNTNFGLSIEAISTDVGGLAGPSSVVRGNVIANNFSDPAAGGDGLRFLSTGDTNTLSFIDFGATAGDPVQAPVLSAANATLGTFDGVIDQNLFNRTNSGNRGLVVDIQDGSGDFSITRNSFIATGNPGAGEGIDASLFSRAVPNGNRNAQMLMTVGGLNLMPGAPPTLGNMFDGNGDAAISYSVRGFVGNASAFNPLDRSFIQVTNNVIQNTSGDGILLNREDAAQMTAVIGDGIALNNNGNLISGNTGAGIHYLSQNGSDQSLAAGFGAPLVYIDDNVIDGNGFGFLADLFADTTVQVIAVTNSVTNTTFTAFDINTANNSSFGMPVQRTTGEDANNDGILQPWEDVNFDGMLQLAGPTVRSSVFDSNFVQNFGIDGFWMTAINGSFQDIRISGTQLSDPNDPTSFIRTLIDGGGGAVDGIHIDAFGSQSVFGSRPSTWTVQGVDVVGVTNDGILVNSGSGSNIYNFGGPFAGQNVVVNGLYNGSRISNDGLAVNAGGGAFDTFNINSFMSVNHGGDGAEIIQTGVNLLVFNMTNSTFNGNVEAGFSADNRSINASFYNIGTEERGAANGVLNGVNEDTNGNGFLDPGEDVNGNGILDSGEDVNNNGTLDSTGVGMANNVGNEFNNNGHQGFFFQTLSPLTGDVNVAGFFISPDAAIPPFPAGTAPQNIQGNNDNGDVFYQIFDPTTGQLIPELGLYSSPQNTSINVVSRLNFIGNQVLSNGTPATQADGMVLSVGTNTNMIAAVDGNLFGGNTLHDFHIITVVSQNPQASQDNVFTSPNQDRIRYDPNAFLDLAFGENFANNPPVSGQVPTGPGIGNIGESLLVETIGHNTSVVGRTEVGVFGNADHVKPEGRNAIGVYSIYTTGGSGDLNGTNVFSQQPSVAAIFANANVTIPGAPLRVTTAGIVIDPSPGVPFPYTNATGQYNTINFVNTAFP